jgi:hypothetical protein
VYTGKEREVVADPSPRTAGTPALGATRSSGKSRIIGDPGSPGAQETSASRGYQSLASQFKLVDKFGRDQEWYITVWVEEGGTAGILQELSG